MDSNPNLLDNSGPEITGPPGRPVIGASGVDPTCFIDRWWGHRGGAIGYAIGNMGASGYPNCFVMQRNAGNADATTLVLGQSTGFAAHGLSTRHVVQAALNRTTPGLAAQTLVFSIHAYKGLNFSGSHVTLEIVTAATDVNICSGAWMVEASATFGTADLSTARWTRFQVTKSGDWTGSPAMVLGVRVKFVSPSGTAGADDTLYLTGAKLELSSTGAATAYVMPTIHESLQRCKRFYQSFGGVAPDTAAAGFAAGAALHQQTHLFPVEMIRPPSATKTGTWSVSNCSQPSIVSATTRSFSVTTTTMAAGPYSYTPDSGDDLVIFDAETP